MEKDKIIELLKSGDFTIIYWDRDVPTLYEKKWDIEKEFARDEYETMQKFEINAVISGGGGYTPDIVYLLTEALGGKAESI